MSDRFQYLHQSHIEGQRKYIYFLLAAAASGIGLAINMTTDLQLTWSQTPLGIALLLWGVSFFSGVKAIMKRNSLIGTNALAVEASNTKSMTKKTNKEISEAIKDLQKIEFTYRNIQFYSIISGAVLFVVWHITEMYCRTTTLTPQDTDAAMFLYRWAISVCS